MKKLTTLFTVAFLSLMLMVQGCKKDKNDDGGKPVLQLTKAQYQPGEIAILQSSKDYGFTESFAGDIDGKSTGVFVMDSNRLGFIVPVKAAGTYTLKLNKDVFENNDISFTIGSYTAIATPAQEISTFSTNVTSRVSELNNLKTQGWDIDQQNIDEINQLVAAYQSAISSLTPQEQEELAYFVKSNSLLAQPLAQITFTDSFYAKAGIDPGDEMNMSGKAFVKSMIINISVASILGGLISVPDLSITKVVALGAAVTLAINMVHTSGILDKITKLIGTAGEFDINTVKKFRPNINTSFIDRIRFRNLLDTDFNTQNYLGVIVDKTRVFERYWNNLQSGLQKISSWFTGAPNKLTGAAKKLVNSPTFKTFFAKQEYITINNVTNNNINVTIVDVAGEKKLKATSNLTQKTNFKFDVTYKHPELGNTITKTVDAEFEPNSVTNPILQQMIDFGPWRTSTYSDGVLDGYLKITFSEVNCKCLPWEYFTLGGTFLYDESKEYYLCSTSQDSLFSFGSNICPTSSIPLRAVSVNQNSLVLDIDGDVWNFSPF